MKKIFFPVLFSVFASAQKNQLIELRNSIKDKGHIAKSLTLIDLREDKNIGTVSHREEPYELKFESEDLGKLFADWFSENNKEQGSIEYFLIIESLKANDIPTERSVTGHLEMKMATFLKRNNTYYFLKKSKISKDYAPKDHAYVTRVMAAGISAQIANIIKDSYDEKGLNVPVSETELGNYEKIISERLPVYSGPFTDGVYADYKSFAEQKPDKELVVKKNPEGTIKGVKRADGYDNFKRDVFAVVDNGIAYKRTPVSLIEIEKDNEGFFITASAEEIFPPDNTLLIAGASNAGAIGGLVAAVIDITAAKIRRQNAKYYRIGIDALTGEYILPEGFGKSR
ncbi:hypothetical protein SD427_00125 [Chryseobacterium sp. JJR-5R]|uniref:hypothetical protein n=1 Tax=Chryseobacterium sp. JJR-5R TaxID=3093923 RepID=UPI002A7636C1|nr:hypothetical protein [Chryseobacterium sp. JJR-5R]WPO82783.1 hypothetical protein SD427_00125 [Chryseobacterium sp. JJR-5R]